MLLVALISKSLATLGLRATVFICWVGLLCASAGGQAPPAPSQTPSDISQAPPAAEDPFLQVPQLEGFENLGGADAGQAAGRVSVSADFQIKQGTRQGVVRLHADIQEGWHIYSTTQPPGGPIRATIDVADTPGVEVTGPFQPDRDPLVSRQEEAFGDLDIEEFGEQVTWSAPIRLDSGIDPQQVEIKLTLNGQVCATSGACELVQNKTAVASFDGYIQSTETPGQFVDDQQKVTLRGYLQPQVAAPGQTINLVLAAEPAASWHLYGYARTDTTKVAEPTLIVLRKTAGWPHGPPQASPAPERKETGLPEEPVHQIHKEPVTWTVPIEVPADAEPGEYVIAGSVGFQICSDQACLPPIGLDFEGSITVGSQRQQGQVPLDFQRTTYREVAEAARLQPDPRPATPSQQDWLSAKSYWAIMALAFLAGLILNVMPCVLPVIGLKIMAFVQQAGGNRWEILSLNLWFSFGLLLVFWVLASLAALPSEGLGWGAQYNNPWFTITMVAIVFAFGLAFLGVWHVPIPGFVGSAAVQGAAQREGAAGAISKGILTTVLATPCAGPLVIPLVSWSVTQPTWLTYLLFTSMGLGMASPYLLIGIFPRLIGILPKPGNWMNTVEQVLGFVLMGTAIFFFNSLSDELTTPTLSLLLGVGIACWWAGRASPTAATGARLRAWATGAVIIAFFTWFSFTFLAVNKDVLLPWQPFSRVTLEQHLEEGRTVMVDFTADW
jgi:thiol:disulfide interchange protein